MIAIFFSRPLTLTINCFAISSFKSPEQSAIAGYPSVFSGKPQVALFAL
jgi:hypothetical protein